MRKYSGRAKQLGEALSNADLIYVRGGNVFVLRRALKQSGADELIKQLLADDAIVYAGYSAGICVLGPTLRGIEGVEDDTHLVPEGYDAPVIWDGLDLLPYAIAPHYGAGLPAIVSLIDYCISNHVPFITLRDGEALVIEGASQTVVG